MHLGRLPAYWAETRGHEQALVHGNNRLTWHEAGQQSVAFASRLQAVGVQAGDRVGCLLENRLEWCIAYYGCLTAGTIFVPFNILFGDGELGQIAQDADCKAIVSMPCLIGRVGGKWSKFDGDGNDVTLYFPDGERGGCLPWSDVINTDPARQCARDNEDDLAVLGYTSGTTGRPKGVMLTHRGISASITATAMACGWNGSDRFLVLSTLAFTGGYYVSLSPALMTGACAYIMDAPDPGVALGLIIHEKISVLQGVPILWDRMSQLPEFHSADLTCLKTGTTGGSPVPPELIQKYQHKGVCIRQGYACTESGGACCLSFSALAVSRPDLCGPPLPSIELKIIDAEGAECRHGEIGEILIRGPHVTRGYWKNPEETALAFDDGWFKTGDCGLLSEEGYLKVVDRKKNMVISGGVNIYPAEIERVLSALIPGADVVAFGVADEAWGEKLVAIISTTKEPDTAAILSRCRDLLGNIKAPKEITWTPNPLPQTPTGKIARRNLPEFHVSLKTGGAEKSSGRQKRQPSYR